MRYKFVGGLMALGAAYGCSGDVQSPGQRANGFPAAEVGGPGDGTAGSGGGVDDGLSGGTTDPVTGLPSTDVTGAGDTGSGNAGAGDTGTADDGTGTADDGSGTADDGSGTADDGTGTGDTAVAEPVLEMNDDGSVARPMVLRGEPIHTRVMRLTNAQWEASVKDILRLDEEPGHSLFFEEPTTGSTDFLNNEVLLEVTNGQWQQYALAAEEIGAQVSATDADMAEIYSGTDSAGFIAEFGRRAFRRLLTAEELTLFEGVYTTGAELTGTQSDFTKGAGLVITSMLQSPHFLYRTEFGDTGAALSSFEAAAKLSLLLRGTTPDDALLAQAEAGDFASAAGVTALATSMLDSTAGANTISDFHAELFEFKRFADISKESRSYDDAMNPEMVEASRAFFENIFAEGLGLKEILTTTEGFVGPETADLYEVDAPRELTLMDLGPDRAGFFSQLPYLMVYARGAQSYAILRGVHMNHDVLCGELDTPPNEVSLVPPEDSQTSRELMVASTTPCGDGCHDSYINPLGFAFENFDGLGRTREEDADLPVDTTGSYPFAGGGGLQAFDGVPELMNIIASNDMAHKCYAKHVAGYILQRDVAPGDQTLIDELGTVSTGGSSVKNLILDLVARPEFHSRVRGE